MKTVTNVYNITVEVSKSELIEDKWLNFQLLSQKLGKMENDQKMAYKQLRNKFYNSMNGNKYNMTEKVGLKCIDVDNPMKATASLSLVFKRV